MIYIYRVVFVLTFLLISYSAFTPSETTEPILYLDKIFHFLAFLILTFLLDISLREPISYYKYSILFLIAFAASIEFIQYFLPYRSAEIIDFLSDFLGILVYLYFAPKIYVRLKE
tara:strand:+ start:177 stop:521 length:345 start_codon:yes stop_codon:yes gene_type:complete